VLSGNGFGANRGAQNDLTVHNPAMEISYDGPARHIIIVVIFLYHTDEREEKSVCRDADI